MKNMYNKNILSGLKSGMKTAVQKVSKLEDRSVEFILSEEQKKKVGRKEKEPQRDLLDSNKGSSICVTGVSERKRSRKKNNEEMMVLS